MDELLVAIHQAAKGARGGISGLARRMGKTPQVLINKLQPWDDTHMPHIGELVAIIEDTGDLAPLEALASLFGARIVTTTHETARSTASAVIHAVAEHGDVVRAVEEALEDGEITEVERHRMLKEIGESRHALAVLENTIRKEAGVSGGGYGA